MAIAHGRARICVAAALALLTMSAGADATNRARVVQKRYVIDVTKPVVPYTGTSAGDKAGVACTYRGPGTQCLTFPTQPHEGAVTVRLAEDSGAAVAFALLGDWNGDGKVADNEVIVFCEKGGLPLQNRAKPIVVNVAFGGKLPTELLSKSGCATSVAQKGTVQVTFLR